MFTIIGSDGKEYGPVTADQLQAWIAAGRANLETKAKAVGSDEWRRLGDFPEFGGAPFAVPGLGAIPASSPAPGPYSPAANLAGLGARLGAALIDGILTMVAATPGCAVLGVAFIKILLAAQAGREPNFNELDVGKMVVGGLLLAGLVLGLLVVQVWMISTRGQSIGKRLVGIKIVRFADGANPGFVNGWLLRNFVNGIICAIPYVGFVYRLVDICFIFGESRRCVHDHIAGTKVVNA